MTKFQPVSFYKKKIAGYSLLPFRFSPFDETRHILSNLVGEYVLVDRDKVRALVDHKLEEDDPDYVDLRAKQFLLDSTNPVAIDLLALKVRTKYKRLAEFTALHIFVVSLRCEHSCPYCQVSRQSEDRQTFDMSIETANRAIALVFRSPSPNIKVEFQGGEPLLNFALIRHIVTKVLERNTVEKRNVGFVIATNLALIDEEILTFCSDNNIYISTSLDGPKDLHNKNRPRKGADSYERAVKGIQMARARLGVGRVSALMTTTEASLPRVREIIDEYLALKFSGIFLRPLSPYGFAIKTRSYRAYNASRWLECYREGLDYIIEVNRQGIRFQEFFASVILAKMLTSQDPGYVDLMNPAGIGLGALVYNYDGSVYASDESRMLAEMGDDSFRIGNVHTDSYEKIITSPNLLEALEESFTLSAPMCSDCAFEPYCGAEPVYHHAITGDFVGRKPESGFCTRNMAIFKLLISKMETDPYCKQLFVSWANRT